VQVIVKKHSGFLIYAGGDDVMALLPLEYALNCAKDLRQLYLDSFADYSDINTTLSGAIEYAHIRMPLGKVLSDAHHLLDKIAKDKTGRDAIAIRVWKPGGQHLEWAMPWEKALDAQGEVIIDKLAKYFQKDQQNTPFSNSFFFHVEERFALLNDNAHADGDFPFSDKMMIDLIAADYLNSGVNNSRVNQVTKKDKINLETARQRIKPLLTQCFEVQRTLINDQVGFKETPTNKLNSKALQLIRFLAQKGVEHG
jgi:CRISPR-associated protein Cmr2